MDRAKILEIVQEALAPFAARLEALENREVLAMADLERAVQPLREALETLQTASPGSKQDNQPFTLDDYAQAAAAIVKFVKREG